MGKILALSSPCYQPKWPKQLDPDLKSLAYKIKKIISQVLYYLFFPFTFAYSYLRNLALRIIVPGCTQIEQVYHHFQFVSLALKFLWNPESYKADLTEAGEVFKSTYHGTSIVLSTPDQAHLDCVFFPGENRKKAILYIGGNGEQWEGSLWTCILKPLGVSILMINSRGVGKSTGFRSEKGYSLDAYTGAKWLIEKEGVTPEDILFLGFSMGAANITRGAALIQGEYPNHKINACNIFSFSDLTKEIQHLLKNKGLLAQFAIWGALLMNFQLNVKKSWDLLKGEKVIFYNPADPIIPWEAQLAKSVEENPQGKNILYALPSNEHIPFSGENAEKELSTFYQAILNLLGIAAPPVIQREIAKAPPLPSRVIEVFT